MIHPWPVQAGPLLAYLVLAATVLLSSTSPPAHAQADRPLEQATTDQLAEQLAPSPPLTRGLRNIVPERRQVDLVINFDFDSDTLQAGSLPLLQNLAQAMNTDRLRGRRFVVEGHTDAKGSAHYNNELSARRARAVVQFLKSQGIGTERLEARGMGFSELLNKSQPDAAENRRVRIVTMSQ